MAHNARFLNPFAIGLMVFAGLAWLIAFMLWIVRAQVTDYATYDLRTAAALTAWIYILAFSGVAAGVGAALIARAGRKRKTKMGVLLVP
jgi:hypothetical protein